MSCKVSRQDIVNNIRNQILDKFDSAKPINSGLAVFIPKTYKTKSLNPQLQQLESTLNTNYGSSHYGPVISYYTEPHGYLIEIHPSEDLARAMTAQNELDESLSYSPREVGYKYKLVENISNNLEKVKKWEAQLKDSDKFWSKLQADLQIPKEQIDILRELEGDNVEEKLVTFVSTMSYTLQSEEFAGKKLEDEYGDYVAPGGWNHESNDILLPDVFPIIESHNEVTNKNHSIGWYRSDEIEQDNEARRILEVQSDLFQHNRGRENYVRPITYNYDDNYSTIPDHMQFPDFIYNGVKYWAGYNEHRKGDTFATAKEISIEEYDKAAKESRENPVFGNKKDESFLKMLAVKNNWVALFLNTIMQDSSMRGSVTVDFPLGKTAAYEIQQHTDPESRIKTLEQSITRSYQIIFDLEQGKKESDTSIWGSKEDQIKHLREIIRRREEEIETIKQTGISSKAFNFYENVIPTTLRKLGYNPEKFTDSHGNEWMRVKVNEEVHDEDFLFSEREESASPNTEQNSKRPVTDNYVEYKRYKEEQLARVRNILRTLYRDRKNPKKDTNAVNESIKEFSTIEAKIKIDIENLSKNEPTLLFQALQQDVDSINSALENSTDIENIKNNIDFLYKFVKGVDINNLTQSDIVSFRALDPETYDAISNKVDKLNLDYMDKLSNLKDQIIGKDVSYVNNVLNNDKLSQEDIKNLFESPKDINWMEKTFLGITSSSTNDTIVPQVVKSYLETKQTIRQSEVIDYEKKLNTSVNKLKTKGDTNFDYIFETNQHGAKTGNIINYISPTFSASMSYFLGIDKKDTSAQAKYEEKIDWLQNNANVIDPRKIPEVKELYKDIYPEYFTFTDQDVNSYSEQLKEDLGPLYEEEIHKVLNALEVFQLESNTLLEDETNQYRFANVARINPFLFAEKFNSNRPKSKLDFNAGGTNTESIYSDIKNVRFYPKRQMLAGVSNTGEAEYINTGYYSEQFEREILNNPDRLEYWKLMKDIYEDYINPTYSNTGNTMNKLSYAKFEEDFIETISSAKGLNKGAAVFKHAKQSFKEFFYEKGREHDTQGLAQNYSDTTRKQIKMLAGVLELKSREELLELATKHKLTNISTSMSNKTLALQIANAEVQSNYSNDINKVTFALLNMSALQKAREDALPVANLLLDAHKMTKDVKGNERKRSVERLENYIDRVIRGNTEKYRGSQNFLGKSLSSENTLLYKLFDKLGSIPFIGKMINKHSLKYYTESEQEMLKFLEGAKNQKLDPSKTFEFQYEGRYYKQEYSSEVGRTLYSSTQTQGGPPTVMTQKEFEDKYQSSVQSKITELGLDLNTAGLIQGILKSIILKGLGLNPISGIFNRIEGKNSGLVMDQSGKYWKQGNIHKANSFMAFSNFLHFLPERLTPHQLKKVQELDKFRTLVNNMNLIQDRKNELERQSEKSKFDVEKYFNIYQFAVENPEMKNQGAIMLAILMDTEIKDIEGNSHKVFNGQELEIYDLVDDNLVLKEQFRTPSNIKNWEKFDIDQVNLTNNQYILTRNKIKDAISRSQGNYDSLDVIDATRTIWGRSLTLFMKWMPEHFMQRFSSGKGTNLVTGDSKIKGRYRYLWENNPALLTAGTATLFTAFGLNPVTGLIGLGWTGFVIAKYFKNIYNKENIQRETNNTLEFISFAKSVVISSLNYPLEFFNSPRTIKENIASGIIPDYSKTNLSEEEIQNLQAVAKELGIKLTMIAFMLLAKRMTWDDDDKKDSPRRQFHNFVDNQMNRMIGSLANWSNPNALAKDAQRLAFLQYLGDVEKFLSSLASFNQDEKLAENFFKATPLPRMLYKPSLPWEDEYEYDNKQWQDRFIKNLNSNGEWSLKKAYTDLRKTKKEEFEKELKSTGLTGDALDREVRRAMDREFPKKQKTETYKSIMDRIESGEKGAIKPPKKRSSRRRKVESTIETPPEDIETEVEN